MATPQPRCAPPKPSSNSAGSLSFRCWRCREQCARLGHARLAGSDGGTTELRQAIAAARFPAYYGKWLSRSSRGEMGLARQIAERFLCEAKVEDRKVEAAVASRNLGLTCFWQGDFTEANAYLEEALRLCGAQHDSQVNGSRTSVGRAHVSVIVKPAARDFERASRQLRRRESSIGFHSFRDCSPRSKPKGKA